jgi:hypothetical protein
LDDPRRIVIQRQLGHNNLDITSVHLQGIDNAEIIETVYGPACPDGPPQRLAAPLTTAAEPDARSSRKATSHSTATSGRARRSHCWLTVADPTLRFGPIGIVHLLNEQQRRNP